jgi:enolase
MGMREFTVRRIKAREILDSRGNPTVEVDAHTGEGFGRASVPSGASTGTYEAVELRDGGDRYGGKGVLKACQIINHTISPVVIGMDSRDISAVDQRMIIMDGSENKSRLGANSILGVSLAVMKVAADTAGMPLFRHLNGEARTLPVPLMNIINGGKHAGNELAIQEFMIAPVGAISFSEALRMGAEVYGELKGILKEKYGPTAINIGDEGGFAPPLSKSRDALSALMKAIKKAGYSDNTIKLALDVAASSFFSNGTYSIDGETLAAGSLLDYLESLVDEYPIISIEDPFQEDDFDSFSAITGRMGKKVQIVGDDLFVTNRKRLMKGIEKGAGNSILLKVNQIGTVSEAMDVAHLAMSNKFSVVVSHRSGETGDDYISDIAVALGCGQIKTGAPARGERVAKYNQLLRIEEHLGSKSRYPGISAFRL